MQFPFDKLIIWWESVDGWVLINSKPKKSLKTSEHAPFLQYYPKLEKSDLDNVLIFQICHKL